MLGNGTVDERYEYINLGVVKNYVGSRSFSSNVEDNIDKTRKKAGMIVASGFDRRKVNPFLYIKFWMQACLPSLLYGVELFTFTPTLIEKFQRCQQWFLKNLFFVPKFTPKHLLLKLSELNSDKSEISLIKFLFLGRLITETKMAPVVRKLFDTGAKRFFDTSIDSLGVLPPAGGGDFHSKVIGMLVVFQLGYKMLSLVFFRVSWKIFGKWKRFFQKHPSKLQFG